MIHFINQISMNVIKTMVAVVMIASTLKEALNVSVSVLPIMTIAIPIVPTSEILDYKMA